MTAGRMETKHGGVLSQCCFLIIKKCPNQERFLLQAMDFQHDMIFWMFLHHLWIYMSGIPKTRTSFFKIIMINFESGLNNFRNSIS